MKKALLKCALVLVAAQALAGASTPLASFKWTGLKTNGTEYLIRHAKPSDTTVTDVHMTCKRGTKEITVMLTTAQQVKYSDKELVNGGKRLPQVATFTVDGKAAGQASVLAGQDEAFDVVPGRAVAIEFTMTKDHALFQAMQSGKSLRFDLPKASSHTISLGTFGALSKAMVAHCAL